MTSVLTPLLRASGNILWADCPLANASDTASLTISLVDSGGTQVVADHYFWQDGTGGGAGSFEAGPYNKWQRTETVNKDSSRNPAVGGRYWMGNPADNVDPGNPFVNFASPGSGVTSIPCTLDSKVVQPDIYWLYKTANMAFVGGAPTVIGQMANVQISYAMQSPMSLSEVTGYGSALWATFSWQDGTLWAGIQQYWTQQLAPGGSQFQFQYLPEYVGKTLVCHVRMDCDTQYPAVSSFASFPLAKAQAMGSLAAETLSMGASDAASPTISFTSPASGYSIPEGATAFTTTFSCSDNIWVKEVQLSVDGVVKTTLTAPTTAPFTPLTSGSIQVAAATLAAGPHTLHLLVRDSAGNTGGADLTVNKAATAITSSISGNTYTSTVPGSAPFYGGNLTLQASASTFSGVGSVVYYIDDVAIWTDSNPTGTVSSKVYNSTALGSDTSTVHSFKTKTFTSGSVLLSTSNTISFRVDNSAPVVTFESPTSGSVFSGNTEMTAVVQVVDEGSGLQSGNGRVNFEVDGTAIQGSTIQLTWADPTTNVQTTRWQLRLATSNLSSGIHNISSYAVDNLGNRSVTASISISISTTSRTVSVVDFSPKVGASGAKGTILLTASTVGTIVDDQLRWYLNGVNLNLTQTAVANGDRSWSANYDTTGLADGVYSGSAGLTAKIYYANSLIASLGKSILIDNTAPTCTFTTAVNGSKITISGTALDAASGVASVEYIVDGLYIANLKDTLSLAGGQSFTINKTTADLNNAVHTVALKVTDKNGNSYTTSSVNVTTPQVTSSITGTAQQGSGGTIFGNYHKGNVQFVGTAALLAGFAGTPSVQVFIDGSTTGLTTTVDGTGRIFTTAAFDTTSLAEGVHSALFKLYSSSGTGTTSASDILSLLPNSALALNLTNASTSGGGTGTVFDGNQLGVPIIRVQANSISANITGTPSTIEQLTLSQFDQLLSFINNSGNSWSNIKVKVSWKHNSSTMGLSFNPVILGWAKFEVSTDSGTTWLPMSPSLPDGSAYTYDSGTNRASLPYQASAPTSSYVASTENLVSSTTINWSNLRFRASAITNCNNNSDVLEVSSSVNLDIDRIWAEVGYTTSSGTAVPVANHTFNFSVDNAGPILSNSYNGTSGLITLSAASTDVSSGVNKVDFYVGSPTPAKVGTSTSAPYTYAWDSASLGAGSYSFYTIATDNCNNTTSTQGSPQTLVVSPPSVVTVLVTSPVANSTVSGAALTVSASISGSQISSVAKVRFYLIDSLGAESEIGSPGDTTAPYSVVLDTTGESDGNYFIVARAFTSVPAQLGSDSVAVPVQIKNNNSVTIEVIAPAGVSGTQTFSATTTGTVDHVKWYAKLINPYAVTAPVLIATDTGTPWSQTYNTVGLTNATYYLFATAEDSGNVVLATSRMVTFNVSNPTALGTYIPNLSHTGSSGPTDYRIVFPVKAYDSSDNEIFAFNETTGALQSGTEVKRLIYELDPDPTPDQYCFYDGSTQINGTDPNPGVYTPWKQFKGLWP